MELTPSAQQALVNRAAELERLGFEVEAFGAATIKVTAVPALLTIEDSAKALLRARRGSRRARSRRAGRRMRCSGSPRLTACHAAVKANYPLTLREDGAHPRRAARDGVLDRLSARPAGDAAADAARDREELRPHMKADALLDRPDASALRYVRAARRHRHRRPARPQPEDLYGRHRDFCCRMGAYALDTLSAALLH